MIDEPPKINESHMDEIRLKQLLAKYCDNLLNDDEAAEFEGILRSSDLGRKLYLRFMHVHSGLDWLVTSNELPNLAAIFAEQSQSGENGGGSSSDDASEDKLGPHVPLPKLLFSSLNMVVRTSVFGVVALLLGWYAIVKLEPFSKDPVQGSSLESAAVVGSIKDKTDSLDFVINDKARPALAEIRTGDVVDLTKGELHIAFASGASMVMLAPAKVEVISAMKVRAIHGRLSAEIEPQARGFTIETPKLP